VYVYGYINGTGPDGGTNLTLEVQYNLEGLGTACINGSCSVEVKGKDTYTCDDVYASQLESDGDDPSSATDDNGHYVLLKNISHTEVGQGIVYVDIGHPVHHLFDRPVVLNDHDGAILACAIFTEIKNNTASDSTSTSTGNSPSGAMGSTVGLVALVILVSSFAASFVTAL
jgi:hypothetical protein